MTFQVDNVGFTVELEEQNQVFASEAILQLCLAHKSESIFLVIVAYSRWSLMYMHTKRAISVSEFQNLMFSRADQGWLSFCRFGCRNEKRNLSCPKMLLLLIWHDFLIF